VEDARADLGDKMLKQLAVYLKKIEENHRISREKQASSTFSKTQNSVQVKPSTFKEMESFKFNQPPQGLMQLVTPGF